MSGQELTCTGYDEDILHKAMEALAKLVPLDYKVEKAPEKNCDYLVKGTVQGHPFVWCIEEKKRFTKTDEPQIQIDKDNAAKPFVLAIRYISPETAERLHVAGIQFIDTVGNAFIQEPPVLIWVKGNKPDKPVLPPQTGRLFKGVGLRVIYALLCRPELIEKPYRDLAETTGVALGTVKNTLAELAEKRFVLNMGKQGKRLLNRKELFERWAAAYPEALKPKLLLGRFRGEQYWWKEVQLDAAVAQWGGEVAAAKLTGYLKPGTVTLYTDKKQMADLVISNRLKKDPKGDVEILERFWQHGFDFGESDTVHPFLIYADLVALGDQRTMETARMIYEKYIEGYFGQD
jgi:hypothetical protein